jgi:hypothetical protein
MPISQPKVEPHMKSVHNVDKLYVCDVCSHMAVNKTEIEDHLKLHKTQGNGPLDVLVRSDFAFLHNYRKDIYMVCWHNEQGLHVVLSNVCYISKS